MAEPFEAPWPGSDEAVSLSLHEGDKNNGVVSGEQELRAQVSDKLREWRGEVDLETLVNFILGHVQNGVSLSTLIVELRPCLGEHSLVFSSWLCNHLQQHVSIKLHAAPSSTAADWSQDASLPAPSGELAGALDAPGGECLQTQPLVDSAATQYATIRERLDAALAPALSAMAATPLIKVESHRSRSPRARPPRRGNEPHLKRISHALGALLRRSAGNVMRLGHEGFLPLGDALAALAARRVSTTAEEIQRVVESSYHGDGAPRFELQGAGQLGGPWIRARGRHTVAGVCATSLAPPEHHGGIVGSAAATAACAACGVHASRARVAARGRLTSAGTTLLAPPEHHDRRRRLSKALSAVLRYGAVSQGPCTKGDGFARLDEVLAELRRYHPTREEVEDVVGTSYNTRGMRRFELQCHSNVVWIRSIRENRPGARAAQIQP